MNMLSTPLINIGTLMPRQARLLVECAGIASIGDLLTYYPYRYEDRSMIYPIGSLCGEMHPVQVCGRLVKQELTSTKGKRRLVAKLKDNTGVLELVWFNKIDWIKRVLKAHGEYLVFGLPTQHLSKFSMTHPELTEVTPQTNVTKGIVPLYASSQKLIRGGVTNEVLIQLQQEALNVALPYVKEILPTKLLDRYDLLTRKEAISCIHFPPKKQLLAQARYRLKFDELLLLQLQKIQRKKLRKSSLQGHVFSDTNLLNKYYHNHLSFDLTRDQKKVIKQIIRDMRSGYQMNRLLQGDVGSGKTIVAFLCGLLPIAQDAQTAILAPTEVLAGQHYQKLKEEAEKVGVSVALLTGSTSEKDRRSILARLSDGTLKLLVGTHALLENSVQFKRLGLAIIDEQHRFGVAQRAKLWDKNRTSRPPHILVMTATPIPRTLAKALYGELDVSVIYEKPKGRKPIITVHYDDRNRLVVFERIRAQVEADHQVYVVYPRIFSSAGEETYKDVMDGYESICRAFPKVPVGILHGKMQPADKAYEMKRFVKGETKIMVGTTILEVGINVPNATMIVIENAEAFGLAQLHQLRGRVGRNEEQSYCLLLSKQKLSAKAQQRIKTMVSTQDGFEVARIDLQSRGPGDVLGVQQSGHYKLSLADLSHDHKILQKANTVAENIIEEDPHLADSCHKTLRNLIKNLAKDAHWAVVS